MHHTRPLVLALALSSVGCLASDPMRYAAVPVATTTVVLLEPPPALSVRPAPLEVATTPFGSTQESPGVLRGEVFAIPEGTRQLPDFRGLRPMGVVFAHELDIAPRRWEQGFPGVNHRLEWFAIRYTGSFVLGQGGLHRFRVVADDGARLTIDDRVVVNNDGIHPPWPAEGAVELQPGAHRVMVEYFQGPRWDLALQVFWTRPDQPEALFRVGADEG